MLRAILCVALGLFVCSDMALAKGQKGKVAGGKIAKVDAEKGTLTVTVKTKTESSDKDFTVTDSTSFVIYVADGTSTTKTGKEGLKDPTATEGAKVRVTCDASGAVTKIELGSLPSKKKNK
jgi:hypothetical protein